MTSGALAVSPTGLLFLGVVVLWAVYLVPLWARERARATADRQAQLDADLMRDADTSQPRVVLTTGAPTLTSTARLNGVAIAMDEVQRARVALRRGRAVRGLAILVGAAALLAAVVAVVTAALPVWAPAAAGAWLATTTLAGAAAAAKDRRRLSAARARVRTARTLQPSSPAQARPVPLFDRGREVVIEVPYEANVDDRPWTPVDVPRPTYTMAPRITHAPPLPWVDPVPSEAPAAAAATAVEVADHEDEERRAATREAHHRAARRRAAG